MTALPSILFYFLHKIEFQIETSNRNFLFYLITGHAVLRSCDNKLYELLFEIVMVL